MVGGFGNAKAGGEGNAKDAGEPDWAERRDLLLRPLLAIDPGGESCAGMTSSMVSETALDVNRSVCNRVKDGKSEVTHLYISYER